MCDRRTGKPVRAGTRNWLSVTSSMPGSMAPPPVSTQPAPSASTTPPWRRLSFTKYMSSRARGSRISAIVRSGSVAGLRIGDFDLRQLRNRGDHRVAVLPLELFGLRHRHLQADGEIVGEVRAADGNRSRVRNRALEENRQIAGVRADVEQANAQLALVGGERALGGGNRLEHRFRNFKPGAVGAGDGALQRAAGAGGNVQIDFKPRAHHAHGIEDARLLVEDELARQQMQNLAVGGQLDGARVIDGGAHVFAR